MPGQEQVSFEIDPRSVIGALNQMNAAILGYEKGGSAANEKLNDSFQRVSNLLLRMNDKQQDSMERLTRSIEKQAAAYGKTGVERLIAQRDAYIKRLGSEEEMVKRVTAAYDKMIAAESGGHGNNFREIGESVKSFLENPLNSAKGAAVGFLEKIGPIGAIVGGTAIAFTAFAAAGFEAAKSLGQYGVQIRDVELRTGLTAKQVEQFSFAARAAGQDVSIFERMMRGLTNAVNEQSKEAETARSVLKSFGVDIADVRNGTASTSDTLLKISDGLRALPNAWERNRAALDLFKKAGIEAVPVMIELSENVRRAQDLGLGPSEADAKRWVKYNEQITELEVSWEKLKRAALEPIAATVIVTFKALSFHKGPDKGSVDVSGRDWSSQLRRFLFQDTYIEGMTDIQGDAAKAMQAAAAKRMQPDASLMRSSADYAANAQIGRDKAALGSSLDGLKELLSAAESTAKKEQSAYFALRDDSKASASAIYKQRDAWREAETAVARYKDQIDRAQAGIFTARPITLGEPTAAPNPYPRSSTGTGRVPSLYGGSAFVVSEADIASANKGVDEARRSQQDAFSKGIFDRMGSDNRRDEARAKELLSFREEMVKLTAVDERDATQKIYELRMMAAKSQQEAAGATLDYLKEEAKLQIEMDKKHTEEIDKQLDSLKKAAEPLINTLFTKPSQFGKQLGETVRAATLKPVTEGLSGMTASALRPLIYGADGQGGIAGMFKNMYGGERQDPVKMSTDQNTFATIHNSAAIAALTAMLASAPAFAGAGAPSYRPSMSGGSSGYSYSNPDGGFSWPSISTGGGINLGSFNPGGMLGGGSSWNGFGAGSSADAFGGGRSGGGSSGGGLNIGGIFGRGSIFGPPGGTSPFAPGASGFPSGGSSGDWSTTNVYNPATGNFDLAGTRSGTSPIRAAGISSLFSGLKDNWFNPNTSTGPGSAVATSSTGFGGHVAGVLTSKGAGSLMESVGMPLAEAGTLGTRRGTWGGVGESTLGGALTGAGIGTMILPGIGTAIGAGVGAAVGAGIGLGEMIAGVESPENKAKRLVMQIYHINIEMQMAQQIAQLAKQKYGGNVSAAVRDPDLRKQLEVYAAGTGQYKNFPTSAASPHAGSLIEQNGQLFQQATYNMGYAGTFQSNLPVAGGIGGSTYANPGTPTYVSLNFDGQSAGDAMTGQFVTPAFVSAQAQAAMNQSMGRTSQAATLQSPGLVV